MTRINCIPPKMLTSRHLIAEYRELPRVFNLVKAAISKGKVPEDFAHIDSYRMGPGHVRFFYTKLHYLMVRYEYIIKEMKYRGYNVTYPYLPIDDIPLDWFRNWIPNADDVAINMDRIDKSLQAMND
jgi:hypothetical protein